LIAVFRQQSMVSLKSRTIHVMMVVLAVIVFAACLPNCGAAKEQYADANAASCSPQEFTLFHCSTTRGKVVSLCVTHNSHFVLIQRSPRQAAVREKSISVEETVKSTSAHSSDIILRLIFDKSTKTLFAEHGSFEDDSAAIATDGSDLTEECKSSTIKSGYGPFNINGKPLYLRLGYLERLGLARNLQNPPDYPASSP